MGHRLFRSTDREVRSGYVRVVDAALIGLLCVAPLFLGGRYAVGRFVYVGLVAAAAISWALHVCFDRHARWRHSASEGIFALALAVVAVQLIPLPSGWIDSISPSLADQLPIWSGAGSTPAQSAAVLKSTDAATATVAANLGEWNHISLATEETYGGLAMLLAYGMVFFVTCQRLNTLSDIFRVLGLIAFASVCFAAVGLIQYASGTGSYLGVYAHPFRTANGAATASFYNNNHFAHLLALGVGPLIAWLALAGLRRKSPTDWTGSATEGSSVAMARQRPRRSWIVRQETLLVCLGLVLFAGLMSLSRGGLIVLLLAITISAGLLVARGALPKKLVAALAVTGALVGVAMGVHGFDKITSRLDRLASGSINALDQYGFRRDVWAANIEAISDFWRLGSGVGTHRFLLPAYLDRSYSLEFTHSESGYLQIALETGIFGLLVCAVAIGLCCYWCASAWRRRRDSFYTVAVAAISASLVASVIHSIWDFVWYIPATMMTTTVLAACACRLHQLSKEPVSASGVKPNENDRRSPAFAWIGTIVVVAASVWMLGNRAGPALAAPAWDNYLRSSVTIRDATRKRERNPSVAEPTFDEKVNRADTMIYHLRHALSRDPNNARAHARLGGIYLVRFELAQQVASNQMPISQIRAAATASKFGSRAALDEWLTRAIGPSRKYLDRALVHSRRALALCPLQSSCYLALSDLSFLDCQGDTAPALLDQARRINPNDGEVLIRSGSEAFAAYDIDQAVRFWVAAYHTSPIYRMKLIDICAGRIPVGLFLEMFQPDRNVLRLLEWRYRQAGSPAELEQIRRYAVAQVVLAAGKVDGAAAGQLWFDAFALYQRLNQTEEAVACARKATRLAEHDLRIRCAVGRYFLSQRMFAESEEHLSWCAVRKPSDPTIRRDLSAAKRGNLHEAAIRPSNADANRR